MLRFYYLYGSVFLMSIFMLIGLITSLFSGLIACIETDLKKVVAISTLSQLGLIFYSISCGEVLMTFFHMLCHALFKALLFLRCGVMILIGLGGQDGRLIGNFSKILPPVVTTFMISSISLFGFPFLAGFYSKDMILENSGLIGSYYFEYIILILCCVLTFLYRVRLYFWGIMRYRMGENLFSFNVDLLKIFWISVLLFWSITIGKLVGGFLFETGVLRMSLFDKFVGILILSIGLIFSLLKVWNFRIFGVFNGYLGEIKFLN